VASRAVHTDVLHLPERVVATAVPSHVGGAPRNVVERLSGVNEPSMIILMTTSRRPQQRYDHRLRELVRGTGDVTIATDLGSSLDGPWLAPQGTDGRRQRGRDEPEHIRTPARDRGAPATREEAHGTPAPRPRPVSELGIHVDARASARRPRQNQDPASGGSGPRVCAVAGTATVPAIVAESIPHLAAAAAGVCA
jgi:hypothetical protein